MPLFRTFIWLSILGLYCTRNEPPKPKQALPKFIADYPHIAGIDTVLWAADSLKYAYDLRGAAARFQTILSRIDRRDSRRLAYCLNQITYLYLKMGQWDRASAWMDSVTSAFPQNLRPLDADANGDFLFNQGLLANHQNKPFLCRDFYLRALNHYNNTYPGQDNHLKKAETSVALGLWCTENALDSAYSYIRSSQGLFDRLKSGPYEPWMSNYYLAQSKICYFDREYEENTNILKNAIQLFDKTQFKDSAFMALCYFEMGMPLSAQNKLTQGLDNLEKGWALIPYRQPGVLHQLYYHTKTSMLIDHVADTAASDDQKTDRTKEIKQIISTIEQIWPQSELRYAFPALLWAYYYSYGKSSPREALKYFEKSKDQYISSPLCSAFYKETIWHGLTKNALGIKRYDLALKYAKRYILFNSAKEAEYSRLSWRDLLKPRALKSKNYLYVPYKLAGETFLEKYIVGGGNIQDLKMAYAISVTIHNLLDRSILSQSEAAVNQIVQDEAEGIYSLAVEAAYLLHLKYPNEREYLDNAFSFMEKQKAYLLFSKVAEGNKPSQQQEYEPFARRANVLYDSLDDIDEQSRINNDKHLLNLRNDVEIKLEILLDSIQKRFPASAYVRNILPNLAQIQREMNDNEAILEYFLSSKHCYLMLIKADKIFFGKTCSKETLDTVIKDLSEHFNFKRHENAFNNPSKLNDYIRITQTLFDSLLGQHYSCLKNEDLIIIPDKTINFVSFDALLPTKSTLNSKQGMDYRKLPYLIHNHTILYSPSFKMYKQTKLNLPPNPKISAMASEKFEDHITDLDTYFPKADIDPVVIRTKSEFMALLNKGYYDIIYIAADGIGSVKEEDSKLFLGKDKNINHTILGNEIPKISNQGNGPLVILSACESASSTKNGSEMPYTFAWYFMRSGAGMVLSSYYKLDRNTTPDIVKHFFAEINAGKSPQAALRASKLFYLADEDKYPEPFFWASLRCFK